MCNASRTGEPTIPGTGAEGLRKVILRYKIP